MKNAEFHLEMIDIVKTYNGVKVNDKISLRVKKGEVHGLVGENGAGKSTLMNVLFGIVEKDEGVIRLNTQEVLITSPREAVKHKIGMVHQHFKLVESMSVIDNIILGREKASRLGFIDKEDDRQKIISLSRLYDFNINPDDLVKDLTISKKQKVEILKMLYTDADLLIFDEPTSVLSPHEIKALLAIIRKLVAAGKSVIIITHKLDEIMDIADNCTVIRKGKYITTLEISKTNSDEIAKLMVGRDTLPSLEKIFVSRGREVLEVKNLTLKKDDKMILNNINFSVNAGEIVGICGIEGNGQKELVDIITGLTKTKNYLGDIMLNSEKIDRLTILERIQKGISHVPEDRHHDGVILPFTIAQNSVSNQLNDPRFVKNGFLIDENINQYARGLIEKFNVKTTAKEASSIAALSGGNQQKVVVAREMDKKHDLLILFQPTRGLDIGAINFIHQETLKERGRSKAILLISYELDELFAIADRLLVMYKGEIVGQFVTSATDKEEVGYYMLGARHA